ncbi:hypothetical protein V8C42DRAFT_199347 [Trichoderma barbatum]
MPAMKHKMTPDYEVRLQLDPATALDSNHEPVSAVLESLKVSDPVSQMNVQFLDKCAKDIYKAGWCVRIRKVEDKSCHELTYKTRYDINDGNIEDALAQAKKDGFHAGDKNYEAQVEWGYEKQTLSISREEKFSYSGKTELDLPDVRDSRKIAIKDAPDKFDDWGPGDDWGTKALIDATIFGPVLARRWTGNWNGIKVYIEVWPIPKDKETGTDYIVEASFKTDSYTTASTERSNLTVQLQNEGWVLAEDALKTKLILERYGCSSVSNMTAENGD